MCLCETSGNKGKSGSLDRTLVDSYPHPAFFPNKTSSHRTHPTGSQPDKLIIPGCACVTDYKWETITLKAGSNTHVDLTA